MRLNWRWILPVFWMILIFYFSAQNGVESSDISLRAGRWIGSMVYSDFKEWTDEEQLIFAKRIEVVVRKGAHATEYAVLAFLILLAMDRKKWAVSFAITTLYAVSDEIHQLFIPGREGKVMDVLIDSMGAIAGVGLYLIFIYVIHHIKKEPAMTDS